MTDKMLDIQIVRAINASGPLTRNQIIARVNDDKKDVEVSLDALITMGCVQTAMSPLVDGQFSYKLKTNFGEIDCKRSEHRQKFARYVSHHGAKTVPAIKSGISFSEGLDRAIWKAANTGRWMMVREIRDILTAVGFRRDDVVSRIQHHISTGRWFERQAGSRNAQFFMLRDDVECPEAYGAKKAKNGFRGEARTTASLDDLAFFKKPSAVIASNPGPITAVLAPTPPAVTETYFPLSGLLESTLKIALEHVKLLVKSDGTLSESIWSLLQDGEEYSSADITLLLRQFGYTSSQISPLLSKRFSEGLLTRRLVEVDGRWVNIYKKAAELPAKYTMQKSVVSAIVEAQQATEVEVIAGMQEVMKTPVEPVSKPLLFDSRIRIKGVEIDIVDFTTLYKELSDSGFVREMYKTASPETRLLTTTHVIKGVTFSREELVQLAKSMYTTANRFKTAIEI
jgi:hypothetical protein